MNKWNKFILVFLGLVTMFFYMGKIVIESGFIAKTASREINQRIASQLGVEIQFQELQLEFFPPAIALNDVTVKDFQDNISLVVGRVEATFGFSFDLLLRGKVKGISLYQGEVIANLNFEEESQKEESEGPFRLEKIFREKYLPVGSEIEKRIGGVHFEDFYVQVNEYTAYVDKLEIYPGREGVDLMARMSGFEIPDENLPLDLRSVDSLDVNVNWQGSRLDFRNLDVLQNLNAYKLSGLVIQQEDEWDYDVNGKFRGDLELIKTFHPDPKAIPKVKGYADFAFKVDSENNQPHVEVDGLIGNLESDFVRLEELTLSGVYRNNILSLKQLRAVQNAGEAHITEPVEVNLEAGVSIPNAKVQLANMHTNDILYFLRENLSDLKARLNGGFSISLSRDEKISIRNEGEVLFDKVMLVDDKFRILNIEEIRSSNFSVEVGEPDVTIKAVLQGKRGSQIQVAGTIDGDRINFSGSSDNIRMEDLGEIAEEKISGEGEISLNVYGEDKDVYFDVTTKLSKQQLFDINLGNLESTLRLDLGNKKLHIRNAKGLVGETAYVARGSFSFEEQERLDLRINIEKGNYKDLKFALGPILAEFPSYEELDATFSAKVRLDLLDDGVRVNGEAVGEDLSYYGEEFGRLVGKFEIGGGKVALEDIILSKSRGKIWGSLNINQNTNYLDYDFKVAGLRLSDFKFYRLSKLSLDGYLEGNFFGSGLRSDFDSTNTLRLSSSKIENRPISDSSLVLTTKKNLATLKGRLLENSLQLDTSYSFDKKQVVYELKVDESDVRRFFALLSPHNLNSESLSGTLKANMKGEFSLNAPEKMNLTLQLREFRTKVENKTAEVKKGQNKFTIQAGEVGPEKIEFAGSLGNMVIGGRGHLGRRMLIRHDGEIGAEVLTIATPKLTRPVGKIQSTGVLRRDSDGELNFFGKIQAHDLGFGIEGLPGAISMGNADISIDSDRVSINKLEARYGEGQIEAAGSVIFAVPYPLVSVNYEIKNTRVGFLKNSYIIGDAEGNLSGQEPPYMLRSKVKIEYGEFGETLAEIISMFKKESSYGKYLPLRVDLSADRLIQQDVRVDVLRSIVVRNNLSELYLTGAANLTGPLGSPTVQGNVKVLPGQSKILFKGQEFIVEEGSVRIDGDSRQPPDLRFIANTTVKDYRIRMELLGSTNNLNVSFSSEPSLSPEDIISLLTVGVTSDISENLSEKERQSTTIYGVGSFLVDQFRINEELNNSLGVRLSVTPEFDQSGENLLSGKAAVSSGSSSQLKSATKVKIEKKVSENVDVSVSSTVGGTLEERQEMNINYNLNNNWSLEGIYEVKSTIEDTTQTDNSFGFDLKFRKTFK